MDELMSMDADGLYKKLEEHGGLEDDELSQKLGIQSLNQGQVVDNERSVGDKQFVDRVVGDQMDVDKYFKLNGQRYQTPDDEELVDPAPVVTIDSETGEELDPEDIPKQTVYVDKIKRVSNNEMPEYIEKLNQKRNEILDSQQRVLNKG